MKSTRKTLKTSCFNSFFSSVANFDSSLFLIILLCISFDFNVWNSIILYTNVIYSIFKKIHSILHNSILFLYMLLHFILFHYTLLYYFLPCFISHHNIFRFNLSNSIVVCSILLHAWTNKWQNICLRNVLEHREKAPPVVAQRSIFGSARALAEERYTLQTPCS